VGTNSRLFASVCRAAFAAAWWIALFGCRAENSPGDVNGHAEAHAGHVIPAHKPKAFPDAVRRLRALNDQFLHVGIGGRSESSTGSRGLQIALDIANWLPEIAADSDMPEAPWTEVNTRSVRLVSDYEALMSSAARDPQRELNQANAEIGNLEKLLLACKPRWFEGPGRLVVGP
jgi:hypothetical protein